MCRVQEFVVGFAGKMIASSIITQIKNMFVKLINEKG